MSENSGTAVVPGADRELGGRPVGPIGLGCMGMSFAYAPDAGSDDPSAVLHRALEIGATLIDTADVYGPHTNEELVGRGLAGMRDRAFLASKCGLVSPAPLTVRPNGRPDHVRAAIDASLSRLGVDHVDLYQLHRVDPDVPLAETWGAVAEAVQAGKARAIGLSEVDVDQIEQAHAVHPVASVQTELSLWSREPLAEVVPWCEANGATFIAYSPLSRGLLTGSIGAGARFGGDDFRSMLPRFTPEATHHNRPLLDVVRDIASRHEATPGQVALAWLLAQSPAVVAIPGTRRVSRLEENVAAGALQLGDDELATLTNAPVPAEDRY
jgi:aryl-alcohol dehydrogenase-like predicted oxidoreductase